MNSFCFSFCFSHSFPHFANVTFSFGFAKIYYSFKVLFSSTVLKSQRQLQIIFISNSYTSFFTHSYICSYHQNRVPCISMDERKLIMIKQTARKVVIPSRRMDFMLAIRDRENENFQFKQFQFSKQKRI